MYLETGLIDCDKRYFNASIPFNGDKFKILKGIFNIESILDISEEYQIAPTLIINNCEFKNFYAIGMQYDPLQSKLYGFGSLISITNPWGGNIEISDTLFTGGYFSSGFFKYVPSIPELYSNLDTLLLANTTARLSKTFGLNFTLVGNLFSKYNQENFKNLLIDGEGELQSFLIKRIVP